MVGIRILHICQEHLAQKLPVEDIDTHGGKIALRVFRFLFKFYDVSGFICIHDAETACFLHGNFDNGDGGVRLHLLVISKHLCVVHLIDVVSRKDQDILGRILVDKVDVLSDGIGSATVNVEIGIRFLTGRKHENAAFSGIQAPAPACCHITVQKYRFVLGQHAHNVNSAVGAVAQREVNNAVFAAV